VPVFDPADDDPAFAVPDDPAFAVPDELEGAFGALEDAFGALEDVFEEESDVFRRNKAALSASDVPCMDANRGSDFSFGNNCCCSFRLWVLALSYRIFCLR